jgi:hypothetical protein
MSFLKKGLLIFFCAAFHLSLEGQYRFECDGRIIISKSDGKTTLFNTPVFIPFAPPDFGITGGSIGNFDALGFNPKDNYIYSVEIGTNYIIRHKSNNTFERIGKVEITDTLRAYAGDCSFDGLYYCYDNDLHKMLVFEVVDSFKLLRQIDLLWDDTSPNKGKFESGIFDFAFDPFEPGTAFTYQGRYDGSGPDYSKGRLLKINLDLQNPNPGIVTPLVKPDSNLVTHIAGLAFTNNGSLSGFGSSGSGYNPKQNFFFRINQSNGQIAPVLRKNPAEEISDGCSCPFNLGFTNAAPIDGWFCNNDVKAFTVTIHNNSYLPVTNITLHDTFPTGTVIKGIKGEFKGTIEKGAGGNTLIIKNLNIAAKERLVIIIEMMSVNAQDGPAVNRAYLRNLPARFPAFVASDDPLSSPEGDPSNFFFTTRPLTKISWKTIPPGDCIAANDGSIIVSSPEFIKGKRYEISIRNMKNWEETIKEVTVDNQSSFTVSGLLPGEYQLYRFRATDDNCSVSLKDTTIILKAPDSLINLKISNNGPICEGDTLLLNSTLPVNATFSWLGPEIFGSGEKNPFVVNPTIKNAGKYEATATYGYCEQKKITEVIINAKLNTVVAGDVSCCVRDTIKLTASTKQKEVTYSWSGPVPVLTKDSVLQMVIMDTDQSGKYHLITSNDACSDTTDIDITIYPTPDLIMADSVFTDFCEPLTFNPKIEGDHNVVSQWFPGDGLSCDDCLNPVVSPLFKNKYALKVKNQFNCADSAHVHVSLDKSGLIFSPNIIQTSFTAENNTFQIFPGCMIHHMISLEIFDRLGNRVFLAEKLLPGDIPPKWDGHMSGKKVSPGVYIWTMKVMLVDGSVEHVYGDILVM